MKFETTILHSELEFREYVFLNYNSICRIIVFEDTLDNTIFFYFFTKYGEIFATKEPLSKDYSFFKKKYEQIAKNINLYPIINTNKEIIYELCSIKRD